MSKGNIQAGQASHIAGATSKLVDPANSGVLLGIFVSSGTSVTASVFDGQNSNGTVLINGATLAAGWNPMPIGYGTGLFVTIGGTSPDVTVVYAP